MSEAGWHLAQVNVGRIKAPLESPQLADFAYRSGHVAVMRRRLEWFERMVEAYLALWRVRAGEIPTIGDAEARLVHLREHGKSAFAFAFRRPPPGVLPPPTADDRWGCPTG
jgi:hypothetical protein